MNNVLDDFVALYEWDFANGRGIWGPNSLVTITQESGHINALASSYLGTMTLTGSNYVNVNGWEGHYIIVRARRTGSATGTSRYGMLYTTASDGTFDGLKRVDLSKGDSPLGEWVNLVYDMGGLQFSGNESPWNDAVIRRLWFDIGGAGDGYDIKSIGIYRRKTEFEGFVPALEWDFTNDLQGWGSGNKLEVTHDTNGFLKSVTKAGGGSFYLTKNQTILTSYPIMRVRINSPIGSMLDGRIILRRISDNTNVNASIDSVVLGAGYTDVFYKLPHVESGTQILFVYMSDVTGAEFHIKSIALGRTPATSIELAPRNLKIGLGQQWQIEASFLPLDAANPTLTWSSSDPSVTVVDGLVTGVSLGEATITALADNGITASCQVSVVELKPRSAGETPTGGMRVRRLNKNGDWTFGSGRSNYATGSEAIYQCVLTALLSFRGDWFLDLDHGIPWFNYLRKNPDLMAMENSVKGAILGVTGVERITEFDINLNPDTRVATVSVSYIDTFGLENGVTTDVNDNR